eukprot:277239_1
MSVLKLFLLNIYAFLALQSRGVNIDNYATTTTPATNNCSDCNQSCYAMDKTANINNYVSINIICTGGTLWEPIPSPFRLTNACNHLNNWLPHGLCSGLYSNQYIMINIPIASCSGAFIEHDVHSFHNELKEIQLTSIFFAFW